MSTEKKVLIFGAGGFVGSYLTKEFYENGYDVYGSDMHEIKNSSFFQKTVIADLTDSQAIDDVCKMLNPDIIVNLAAISSVGLSWRMPQKTMQVNIIGALNVLDAAKSMTESPKVLLIGSSEEYAPSSLPLTEKDSIDATNPYGISKLAQERLAEAYEKQYGMRIYRTRSFNHTGVGQLETFVLASWCKQVAEIEKSGEAGVLRVGNIDVKRDFSDVRDVVRAYRVLVESDYYGTVFNVCSGNAITLRSLAEEISSLCAQDVTIIRDSNLSRAVDNPVICGDLTKTKQLLGWEPKYCIYDTLKEMYEYYLQK